MSKTKSKLTFDVYLTLFEFVSPILEKYYNKNFVSIFTVLLRKMCLIPKILHPYNKIEFTSHRIYIIRKKNVIVAVHKRSRIKKTKTYCKRARCHVNEGCYSSFPCLKRSYTPIFCLCFTPSNFLSLSVSHRTLRVDEQRKTDVRSHWTFRYFGFDRIDIVTMAMAMAWQAVRLKCSFGMGTEQKIENTEHSQVNEGLMEINNEILFFWPEI